MTNCKEIELCAGQLYIRRNRWSEKTPVYCPYSGKDCRVNCPLFFVEHVEIGPGKVRIKSVTLCSGIKWEPEVPGIDGQFKDKK